MKMDWSSSGDASEMAPVVRHDLLGAPLVIHVFPQLARLMECPYTTLRGPFVLNQGRVRPTSRDRRRRQHDRFLTCTRQHTAYVRVTYTRATCPSALNSPPPPPRRYQLLFSSCWSPSFPPVASPPPSCPVRRLYSAHDTKRPLNRARRVLSTARRMYRVAPE